MFSILVFGDSIVFGRGDNLNRGWVGRLRKYFEGKDYYNGVYNLGIPGDTSTGLLKRFDVECRSRVNNRAGDDSIIIVGIGINDSRLIGGKPEVKINKFETNIKNLIEKAKKYSANVVFVGLTPVDEKLALDYEGTSFSNNRISEYNDVIRKNCKIGKVLFVDLFSGLKCLNHKKILDDGLHLNAKGYEHIFRIVKKFLVSKKIIS